MSISTLSTSTGVRNVRKLINAKALWGLKHFDLVPRDPRLYPNEVPERAEYVGGEGWGAATFLDTLYSIPVARKPT